MTHATARLEITLTRAPDLGALAPRWRALEAGAGAGFFRGWCFTMHQMARYADPYLLAVTEDGVDLAFAVLNRAGGRFHLGAADGAADAVFAEHNGLLVRAGAAHVRAPALRRVSEAAPLVLHGVDVAHLDAAGSVGRVVMETTRFAPAVNLAALQGGYLDTLSANARGQIRRSQRLFGAGLALSRAADTDTALAYFDALRRLHQAAWQRRGKPGAFADPAVRVFHQGLIRDALAAGEVDLLRVAIRGQDGAQDVGYLYNFRHGGRVFCYQSGFAAFDDGRLKPGLVAHALAIERYRALGACSYDFLGGPDRYKLTLAPVDGESLHWCTLYAPGSVRGRAHAGARAAIAWARGRVNLP